MDRLLRSTSVPIAHRPVPMIPFLRASRRRPTPATPEFAASLKRENPARTAAQVGRTLRASAGWAPSESTLLQHFRSAGPVAADPAAGGCPADYRTRSSD
ncbi:hypothetical protein HX746_31360 (plasmid) [Rhodococcus erythropolis]|uniref:hypothetical protein n=1 Tax=Rhodococcus erythropolis TaxID=1833 RepID=UPI001ADD302C|nr:hypothetical protein [Rhodococcus erythropolis]MBO8150774.1 hypothetical protein [Rhodococcus erythropolis]